MSQKQAKEFLYDAVGVGVTAAVALPIARGFVDIQIPEQALSREAVVFGGFIIVAAAIGERVVDEVKKMGYLP
jgi:hypothetical protein